MHKLAFCNCCCYFLRALDKQKGCLMFVHFAYSVVIQFFNDASAINVQSSNTRIVDVNFFAGIYVSAANSTVYDMKCLSGKVLCVKAANTRVVDVCISAISGKQGFTNSTVGKSQHVAVKE
eukprot:RCo013544